MAKPIRLSEQQTEALHLLALLRLQLEIENIVIRLLFEMSRRLLLKDFVLPALDKGTYPNLLWINAVQNLFCVVVRHAANSDYNRDYDALYRDWENTTPRKYSSTGMKQRLYAALKSSPHFEEVPVMTTCDRRVYRVLRNEAQFQTTNSFREQGHSVNCDVSVPSGAGQTLSQESNLTSGPQQGFVNLSLENPLTSYSSSLDGLGLMIVQSVDGQLVLVQKLATIEPQRHNSLSRFTDAGQCENGTFAAILQSDTSEATSSSVEMLSASGSFESTFISFQNMADEVPVDDANLPTFTPPADMAADDQSFDKEISIILYVTKLVFSATPTQRQKR